MSFNSPEVSIHRTFGEFFFTEALQIIPWIPLRRPNIPPHIAPESQHHVDNNGGAHCKQGSVHKVLPDPTGGNTHPVADGRTNAKGIPFNKALEFVHTANLVYCHKRSKKALFTPCFFVISSHLLLTS